MFALCLIPHVEKVQYLILLTFIEKPSEETYSYHTIQESFSSSNHNCCIIVVRVTFIRYEIIIELMVLYGHKFRNFYIPYNIFHGSIKWALI